MTSPQLPKLSLPQNTAPSPQFSSKPSKPFSIPVVLSIVMFSLGFIGGIEYGTVEGYKAAALAAQQATGRSGNQFKGHCSKPNFYGPGC